ncbi:MAG: endonuclease domain-containing protein [Deltaproteobacteria bacterium]|nr:endonuclease domain-containing protein [Deltaproteobacteria bacterium]
MLPYNPRLKEFSREPRKNMTEAEKLLWSRLRRKQLKGLQYYRQRIIGNFIVDFYCPGAGLVIEVDGGQHYTDKGIDKDARRDSLMEDLGLKVMRFSDRDVFENLDGVLKTINENM